MAKKIITYGNRDRNNFPTNNNVVFNNNTLFQINDITVTTNFVPREVIDYQDRYHIESTSLNLNKLNINSIEDSTTYSNFLNRVVLSFDRKNLNNYAYFGSLYELIRSSISDVILKWKGSLYVDFFNDGQIYNTVNSYFYNSNTDKSYFKINAFLIQNKFGLNYVKNTSLDSLYDEGIKDLNYNYKLYELFYVDSNGAEYTNQVLNFTGSTDSGSGSLSIEVDGQAFPMFSSSTSGIMKLHIRPIQTEYVKFYSELNTLQKYLLNKDSTPQYTATFKILEEDIDGNITFRDTDLTWETSDGYNIDIDTIQYGQYLENLLTIAQSYDEYKSDLIARFLTPSSLLDFDNTNGGDIEKLLRIYGREFDEIKSFIDGLVYVNKVSYDKVENIPDVLIKNLAQNLGWNAFNIVDEEDIINSLFSYDKSQDLGFYSTPFEIDIELWRRIIINTNWFFKAKGTRKAIEVIFSFIGAPDCLIDFNEHIYLADQKINIETVDNVVLDKYNPDFTRLPYDDEGFPKAPNETNGFYFQISGNTDAGQQYINLYRDLGYDVTKTIDNRKSWPYVTGQTSRLDDFYQTSYNENDSRLIINTKEVSINLDIARAIECDVYNFNYSNNYPVSSNGRPFSYPDKATNRIDVTQLSFAEYIQEVYSKFINAQNRKIIDDGRGGGYPTLTKLYYDYLNNSLVDTGTQSNERTVGFMLDYIEKFDKVWPKFIDQLIPATTIFEGGGEKYRNTIFTPQKFVYKAGIDSGSEFETDLPSVLEQSLNIIKISSEVKTPAIGDISIFKSHGSYVYSAGSTGGDNNNNFLSYDKSIINFWDQQKWDYNFCEFDIPTYTMSGASKIVQSSFTMDSVFYYDEGTGKDLKFVFNSEIQDIIDGFTGINFTLNKHNKNTDNFDSVIIYNKELSGYTLTNSATTLTYNETIVKASIERDAEYLIKVKYIRNCYKDIIDCFSGDCFDLLDYIFPYLTYAIYGYLQCYLDNDSIECNTSGTTNEEISVIRYNSALTPFDYYENFDFNLYPSQYADSNNFFSIANSSKFMLSGYTFDTSFEYDIIDYLPFKYYVHEFDYYFVSVGSPSIPSNIINIDPTVTTCSDFNFITESIPVTVGMTAFTTTYNPIGDIQIALRGLVLTPLLEYEQDTTFLTTLSKRFLLKTDPLNYLDTLTVSYMTDSSGADTFYKCESYYVSSITQSGSFPPIAKFTYNTGNTKYEYYLDSGITSVNNVNITVRGQVLSNGNDFTLSILDNRLIIFNVSPFMIGDEINACYVTQTTSEPVYQLDSNPYIFSWNINTPIPTFEVGRFYQEFTTPSDANFNSIVFSSITNYIDGSASFSKTIDFLSTPLILGNTYRYRVTSEREYTTISNNVLIVKSYSDDILIKIPN